MASSPHSSPDPRNEAQPADSGARPELAEGPWAVEFEGVDKTFFGVKVLKAVSFGVASGRITGLVGENGAGKSTLMNLLGGNLTPDAGSLRVDGQVYAPRYPDEARRAGISFVHQELNLFPNLSIAENLFLINFPRLGARGDRADPDQRRGGLTLPWINRGRLAAESAKQLSRVGLDLDPGLPVERLSAGERQLVEIARALSVQARVLILDEPTSSLSSRECERLFALLDALRKGGMTMIYISHALDDVLRLCDDLVVLRDGAVVGRGPARTFAQDRLVTLMVGRQLDQLYPDRPAAAGPALSLPNGPAPSVPALEVRGVTQPGIVKDVSFELAAGEVLGIAGLMGAGRSELARILFGLDPCARGDVRLAGRTLAGSPRRRIQHGLAFLTEDRRAEGLCMEAAIADNIALVTLPALSRPPLRRLDFPAIRAAVQRIRTAVGLSPHARDEQPVRTLSGGNQQKVVLAKWLLAEPKVLILDEPTRGIDVGAKFEIYQLIRQLAARGAGVLVISSEIEELIGICDRLLVMGQGVITAEFRQPDFNRERILAAALPAARTFAQTKQA